MPCYTVGLGTVHTVSVEAEFVISRIQSGGALMQIEKHRILGTAPHSCQGELCCVICLRGVPLAAPERGQG